MQGAGDAGAIEMSAGERGSLVGAKIVDGPVLAVYIEKADDDAVGLKGAAFSFGDIAYAGYCDEVRHVNIRVRPDGRDQAGCLGVGEDRESA